MIDKKLYHLKNSEYLLSLQTIIYFCSELIATFNHKMLLLNKQYLSKNRNVLFHVYEICA